MPHAKLGSSQQTCESNYTLATRLRQRFNKAQGISERFHRGEHLGGVPFGLESCYEKVQLWCEEEHPRGVPQVSAVGEAVKKLF